MKNQTGIWIDTSRAIIVSLLDGKKYNTIEIESDIDNAVFYKKEKEGNKGTFSGSHHSNNENKFDERRKNQLKQFLKDVLYQVKEADELYIFGPAETKTRLKQKMLDKYSSEAHKLKSVENADHLTSNQIVAKVKQFYNIH